MASVAEVMKMANKVMKLQQRKNAEEMELQKIEAERKQMDRKARTHKLIVIGSIFVSQKHDGDRRKFLSRNNSRNSQPWLIYRVSGPTHSGGFPEGAH